MKDDEADDRPAPPAPGAVLGTPRPRRNLIVCCDGTSNGLVQDRTNVVRIWLSLARTPDQLAYYDPGVGTLGSPGAFSRLGRKLNRLVDMVTGKGVRENVIEAYEFLMENYEDGDALYFFGFSRGAYTARALAGMLDMFGLLAKGSKNLVPYVWQLYSNDEKDTTRFGKRLALAASLKKLNRKPRVHFLGVWDTVSSWGWFFNFGSLPHTKTYRFVDHIRHAVALDERRAAFRQNRFKAGMPGLIEMWFPGVHADVGGGYPESESGLARDAFVWMVAEARALGLRFDDRAVQRLLEGDPDRAPHKSLRGLWWILEYLPRRTWIATDDGHGAYAWRLNRGRSRFVPGDAVRFEQRRVEERPPT